MNLAREGFKTLLFQISGFLCATVAGIITARVLGPSNKGIIAVVLLYPALFFTLFNITAGMGIIHHIGQKKYDKKKFAGSALLILIATTALTLTVYIIAIALFHDTLFRGISSRYLLIAGASIPFYLMLYFYSSILQGSKDINGYNYTNQITSYANLFFLLIFIAFWKLTVIEALLAGISGFLIGGIAAFIRTLKMTSGIAFNTVLTRELIRDGLKIHLGAVANFIFMRVNVFILNYYAPSAEVGFYSVAFGISSLLFFLPMSLEIALYPRIAHAEPEEAVEVIQVATRQMLLMTTVVALFVALFSRWIVLLYGGESFLPATLPLIYILPGVVMYVIPKMLSPLWLRKGWFFPMSLIASCTALVSLALNFVLVPRFGANGASIAMTVTYCFSGAIGIGLFMKFVKRDVSGLFIPRRSDLMLYRELLGSYVKR